MSSQSQPFRFRDLPQEIRDKIYRELLCDFKPRPTTFLRSNCGETTPAPHDIETAILRTSTSVYREAYDVMIKINRFVKITSTRGLGMNHLLCCTQVPVVAANKESVERFGGYVLAVHLDSKQHGPTTTEPRTKSLFKPRTLMILHRDIDVLCHVLMYGDGCCPGFIPEIQLTITFPPLIIGSQPTKHSPSFADFFSDTTKQTLLAPLRAILRGFESVEIQGHADQDLACAVQADLYQDRWSDPGQVLMYLNAATSKCSTLYEEGNVKGASLFSMLATSYVDTALLSSSWPTLVELGGEDFVFNLGHLYFLMRLNSGQIMYSTLRGLSTKQAERSGKTVIAALASAIRSMRRNHYMEGYKFQPSSEDLANLAHVYALLLRWQNEPGTAE
jgi:hypothetical protein